MSFFLLCDFLQRQTEQLHLKHLKDSFLFGLILNVKVNLLFFFYNNFISNFFFLSKM